VATDKVLVPPDKVANSCGVEPIASAPRSANFAPMSSIRMIFAISA